MPGTSFDRVADIYDRSRGGQRRGDKFAAALAPWITGSGVAELGVGTGVIARGLRAFGHDVVGFDLSAPMLAPAVARLGPQVAVADVEQLPLADDSVDTVIFVWVLHLVDDPGVTLAEAARVVRPGGRVMTILANAEDHPDDEIAAIFAGFAPLRQPDRGLEPLLDTAPSGLALAFQGYTPWDEFTSIPNDQATQVEQRSFSSLFDVDAATWESVVVPVIEALRAMPRPDQPYTRRNRHPLIVWNVQEHM